MTNDEILVFYQYDRLATQPSDLWHCALSLPVEDDDGSFNSAQDNNDANGNSNSYIDYFNTTTNNNTERSSSHLRVNDASTTITTSSSSSRESFDIRALIVFDEVIDYANDRFHPERVRPVLSIEESGCFCDEQAFKKRTQ